MSVLDSVFKKLNPLGYALIGAGFLLYATKSDFSKYLPFSESGVFIASILLTGYGAAIVLMNYLRGNRFDSKDDSYLRDELRVLRNEMSHGTFVKRKDLQDVEEKINKLENITRNNRKVDDLLPESERELIVAKITGDIISNASNSVLKEIEKKYSDHFKIESQASGIQGQLENTRLRLRAELEALGRRGNVNLVIGVLTTLAAVSILTATVLDRNIVLTSDTLLSHYAPRLTLSLFVEIFSFFFLKLYKSGLSEIKYFQNELTNIELKFVSLDSALRTGNEEIITRVIGEFSKTERNFVLEKGQSTVDLERTKVDLENTKNLLGSMSKLVDTIKK
ncbi:MULTISPECIES: hypothetical protein [unclassified Pseudomonas]|uniref:hypothetical protein n=1 Tax=unclassified Pseudomonas TaxID=196821 RepID=UPI00102213DF|nr:hypothetical protein [Pseudomonas sp. B10]